MDKVKARKMYELATRLSKVNASELTEQQLSERNSMIARLQEEMKKIKENTGKFDKKQTSTGTQYTRKSSTYTDDGSGGQEYSVSIPSKKIHDDNDREYNFRDDDDELEEAGEDTTNADIHYNVNKLGGEIGVDPRVLRTAIQRSMLGSPTRQDTMTLADAFLAILKNGDDQTIQRIANLIKSGNPREIPQESTAAIAERNAFVDAMRQVKKGEKFNVGGKEFTKTTSHGTTDKEEVKEEINTEAYDRLRKVFDFSNFKG